MKYYRITLFLVLISFQFLLSADEYYVATSGDGSSSSPWATISYGVSQLSSGDTLYINAGTYRESYIGVKYSSCNGVTLKSIGGEVNINNDIEAFDDASTGDWTVYDSTKKIYRSTSTYTGASGNNYAFGFFEHSNRNYKLVPYTSWTAFSNSADTEGGYIGPGTFYDVSGSYGSQQAGAIYIRLAYTEQIEELGLDDIDQNPDNLKIHLSVDPLYLQVWKAPNVTIDGLSLINAKISVAGTTELPSPNVTIRNSSITGFYAPKDGKAVSIGIAADNCVLDQLYLTDNQPEWICWEDVKIFSSNYSLMNSAIQNYGAEYFSIRGCYIKDSHDGIWATTEGSDWDIHDNIFQNIQDDAIQLSSYTARINIHHNAFIDCGTSISKHAYEDIPDNPDPGKKYIHHNLIDTQKPRYWHRRESGGDFAGGDSNGRLCIAAFGQHSFLEAGYYKDPRKIYNNTILSGKEVCAGRTGSNISGVQTTYKQEVYNNIMFVDVPTGLTGYLGNASDQSDPNDHSTLYDGNCHYFIGTQTDPDSLYMPYMLDGLADIADFDDIQTTLGRLTVGGLIRISIQITFLKTVI